MKISVIIPFFNAERYLRSALDSVAAQTFRNFECICVDDGSTDGSLALAEGFARQDNRFRVICQRHCGPGIARNEGIAAANGECLAFLDADDAYESDFLEKMVGVYEQQMKCDIVICGVWRRNEKTGELRPAEECLLTAAYEAGDFLNCTPGIAWNKLFSHAFVDKCCLRFLDTPFCEDIGFVYPALAMASRIGIVRERLVRHREGNDQSLEHMKNASGKTVFYDAYLNVRDQLKVRGAYGRVRSSFIRRVGAALRYNANGICDLAGLKAFYERVKPNAEQDFELLGDVASVFDEELQMMRRCTFDEYVLSRLRQARKLPSAKVDRRRLVTQVKLLERDVTTLRKDLQSLRRSSPYRLGMIVLWPVRRALDIFKGWKR